MDKPADIEKTGETNPLLGIGLKVMSVVAFMAMATCIKLAGQLPAGQLVFFRSAFAIIPIVGYLAYTHQLKGVFHTQHPVSHVIRGLVGLSAMSFGFYGLTRLPLPDAVALGYAGPLFTVVFGALFLGEVVRRFRWSAVAIGFTGVLIISWPKLQVLRDPARIGHDEVLGVFACLAAALISAVAAILIRRLVRTERTSTIVLYFSITATLFSLLTLPLGWHALSQWQVFVLVMAGFLGGVGQILMTQSYRFADTSTIAPFEYTSVLLSLAIGFWVFSDEPTVTTLIGSAIVVAAGISIILREHYLGLKRPGRKAMTPQG